MISLPEAQSALTHDKDLVRVRLLSLPKKIQLTGQGLRFLNLAEPYRSVAIPENKQAEVRLMKKDGKNLWALKFNNQDREHLFTEKYLMIQGDGLRVGSQTLPNRVLLSSSGQQVDVVGVMPLDEYIVGVLASEMPLGWPLETLKAQAVAARSYTLAVMAERQEKAYHLESSVLDQVFRHIVAEDENDPKIQKALQAVRETEGVKLFGPGHKILKAFYHADCGGQTTLAKNVWNGGVNSGTAVDSSCPTSPSAQWTLKVKQSDLAQRLHLPSLAELATQKVIGDARVRAVKVAMNDGTQKAIGANEFRQALGFSELRSTLFDVKKSGEEFVFTGRGFGHGVGLCQWGSRAMGMRGHSYVQILKHYYPLAKLN
ncbi:MAG: SpoIID/LytB domain-containing protein [Bdellovibrio sp.]|nr:SpoIID/LytB domain-containing protein [Bdellovibrio sp.]